MTYQSIWLRCGYVGNPTSSAEVRIETDSNGEPSGTLIDADAYGTVDKAIMSGSAVTWNYFTFNGIFTIPAGTPYHIVLKDTGTNDSSNYYQWYYQSGLNATYKFGNAGTYDGGWTNEPDIDMKFKLCFGGLSSSSWNHTYSIYQIKRYL
jgi:hypothetical protein